MYGPMCDPSSGQGNNCRYVCFRLVAHYLGGKLAHVFGVTSPDWQFAIDIHEEMEREAREEVEAEGKALRHLQE